MTGWCPRCDALTDGQATCPTCGTPLADLTTGRPRPVEAAPPPPEPPGPALPGPSRARAALAVAVVVLAGLAFLAGRLGGGNDPAGAAATQQTVTSTTAPPDTRQGRRVLGWSARKGDLGVTAVAVERFGEDGSRLTLRIDGLARGQEVLALAGLALRDAQGGLFASPDDDRLGVTRGVPVARGRDGSYEVELGPTPALGALREIELTDLVVGKTSGANVTLATPRPWPSGSTRRTIDPGPKGTVKITARTGRPVRLQLAVTAAFVGGDRADAVIAVKPDTPDQELRAPLPVTAQLRRGDEVLCARTKLIGGAQPYPALVVGCPTGQLDQLTVALGAGSSTIPLPVTLRPRG